MTGAQYIGVRRDVLFLMSIKALIYKYHGVTKYINRINPFINNELISQPILYRQAKKSLILVPNKTVCVWNYPRWILSADNPERHRFSKLKFF